VLVISKEYWDSNKLFFFTNVSHILYPYFSRKNLADHWDLPNTGIFNSKDVASGFLDDNPLCSLHLSFFVVVLYFAEDTPLCCPPDSALVVPSPSDNEPNFFCFPRQAQVRLGLKRKCTFSYFRENFRIK
jgi:hypothetical protein